MDSKKRELDKITKEAEAISLSRYHSFSDAVFAVAMTLLVLDIKIPEIANKLANQGFVKALSGLENQFTTFVASFFIIGIFWWFHNNIFKIIKRQNKTLFLINLLFLLGIVFLPFSTGLYSANHNQLFFVIYNASLAFTSFVLAFLWWYASRNHRLIHKVVTPETIGDINLRNFSIPIIFLLVIIVSFFTGPKIARLGWLLLLIPLLGFGAVFNWKLRKSVRYAFKK